MDVHLKMKNCSLSLEEEAATTKELKQSNKTFEKLKRISFLEKYRIYLKSFMVLGLKKQRKILLIFLNILVLYRQHSAFVK